MADIIDPNESTKPSISRRGFIGVSALAGVAAGSGLAATATAAAQFGTVHEPLVPENDPAITIVNVELPRPDVTIDGYAAIPRDATRLSPGVVVVQAIWGVDTQLRDVVRRFAKAGFAVIAPNLYFRFHAPSGDGATDIAPFKAIAQQLNDDQVDGDLVAGAAWLRQRAGVDPLHRPPKVGITGFCMGGGIALRVAATAPAFDACAIWYGRVTDQEASELTIPMLGSYGGRDTSIPVDGVREFQSRLTVPNEIKIYPEAGHAFFDDQRKSYVASAATDAWSRTLAWFTRYL